MSADRFLLMSSPVGDNDRFGEEVTPILNDGKSLSIAVRGVCFQGTNFDRFVPQEVSDPAQLPGGD